MSLASHAVPESCPVIFIVLGADVVPTGGRQHRACRQREMCPDLTQSEAPRTHRSTSRGSREIPGLAWHTPGPRFEPFWGRRTWNSGTRGIAGQVSARERNRAGAVFQTPAPVQGRRPLGTGSSNVAIVGWKWPGVDLAGSGAPRVEILNRVAGRGGKTAASRVLARHRESMLAGHHESMPAAQRCLAVATCFRTSGSRRSDQSGPSRRVAVGLSTSDPRPRTRGIKSGRGSGRWWSRVVARRL